jgi:hypothetical protein
MTHIFQNLDSVLINASKGMCDISSFHGSDKCKVRDAYKNPEFYDSVIYSFPNDELSKQWMSLNSSEDMIAFGEKYGEKATDEESKLVKALTFIWCMTEDDRLAQKMIDDFYYNIMKKHVYFNKRGYLDALIRRESNKSIASKPRNKNKERALAILSATWDRHPTAPQESLCIAVRNYLNGGVSVDSLKKWIKTAGIRPAKTGKCTSFSLVIPDVE